MKNIIIILGFLTLCTLSYGQSISGPTSVTGGQEYTYTYSTNVAGEGYGTTCFLSATDGKIVGNSMPILGVGAKSLSFKVKWDNVTKNKAQVVVSQAAGQPLSAYLYVNITQSSTGGCNSVTISENITSKKDFSGCTVNVTNTTISSAATVTITGQEHVTIKPNFTAAKGSNVSIKVGSNLKSAMVSTEIIEDVISPNKPILDQNVPNPFTDNTKISLFIPEESVNAQLHVFDLSGRVIEKIDITEKGNSSVMLGSYKFQSGSIYLYSLIVDGKVIDTKKFFVK